MIEVAAGDTTVGSTPCGHYPLLDCTIQFFSFNEKILQ